MAKWRFSALGDNPFERLNTLLAGAKPGADPILMSLGEPQHAPPDFVADILYAHRHLYGKYPPLAGTPEFLEAVSLWLSRRFALPDGTIAGIRNVIPLSGTREGLFLAPQVVVPARKAGQVPAILMPNPFYHAYAGAAVAAGAEPIYLAARRETGFLPDIDAIGPELLARTAAFYLCSPANPQGTVADLDYLRRLVHLARQHDFLLLVDECYAEIYTGAPPPSALQAGLAEDGSLANILVFHSLSKRSNVPGLRSGFVAGDTDVIARFRTLRSYGGALPSLPTLAASTALWRDEIHVEVNRALYREKFAIAERILGNRLGFYRPAGGFFLWLDVGDSEGAARHLWTTAGVKVLPGRYLARDVAGEPNPGAPYIRLALVHDSAVTDQALRRLAEAF
ncbi:MAG: aminotransferase class I/II-fold pyridoxal phosphate-dependent enzyme [Alphaproteobacteria bacterium]|nr:aminotransferase class I/II-fold pyridoxal phosphate-dependent enzyme [Alphaproteobacteria bacterium]